MSLEDGRYAIITASPGVAPPPSPIGADVGSHEETPVVVNGTSQHWQFKKTENGNYTITIEAPNGAHLRSVALGNDVFVDVKKDPHEWKVSAVKSPWKGYVIQLPEGGEHAVAWTIFSNGHGSPISLRPVELMPTASQVWRINKIADE
ncbi:hypothetical protein NP233_g7639 [Leucocoprinus birnbaumii]|uniref:Uncharacterized protein n=1 Tax=Leucocoprinus birnbaumii TaxID=56174 RepID=A0AAD5VS65_9AGAR|nr:hypothetical protein NP233_g7639 [Leucocoprinus birnbaumii]